MNAYYSLNLWIQLLYLLPRYTNFPCSTHGLLSKSNFMFLPIDDRLTRRHLRSWLNFHGWYSSWPLFHLESVSFWVACWDQYPLWQPYDLKSSPLRWRQYQRLCKKKIKVMIQINYHKMHWLHMLIMILKLGLPV